jgi:hypothetical protein
MNPHTTTMPIRMTALFLNADPSLSPQNRLGTRDLSRAEVRLSRAMLAQSPVEFNGPGRDGD